MITNLKIGYTGRLGNQMFQFAGVLGIGRKLGYKVLFPIENSTDVVVENLKDGSTSKSWLELPTCFEIDNALLAPKEQIIVKRTIIEKDFHFSRRFFFRWLTRDNSNLRGYFQTAKYFNHIKQEVYTNFTFKEEYRKEAQQLLPKNGKLVSVHLRLGDYLALPNHHPVCSAEYYKKAMAHFVGNDYTFIIFSDDIEGAKPYFPGDNIQFFSSSSAYTDMQAMSLCHHNIIANSSFSWWAAYLNKNPDKKVIAPLRWFGTAYNHNMDDLYCDGWIKE